jgi:hypothetical protein
MDQLLFQTFSAASLGFDSNGRNFGSNNNNSSSWLSASVTTAARVAIQRANYASMKWPSWCLAASDRIDTAVPFLPCAYTFSIVVKMLIDENENENSVNSNNLQTPISISNITLIDEEGNPLEQDFVCWEPRNSANSQSGPFAIFERAGLNSNNNNQNTTIHISFETARCMSVLCFDILTQQQQSQSARQFELSVLANDSQIYGSILGVSASVMKHVVPFCPDERILSKFKTSLFRD